MKHGKKYIDSKKLVDRSVLYEANDALDLARVISAAIGDEEKRRQIGQNARETIPVPWEGILEKAVERYTRLIALGKEGRLNRKYLRVI